MKKLPRKTGPRFRLENFEAKVLDFFGTSVRWARKKFGVSIPAEIKFKNTYEYVKNPTDNHSLADAEALQTMLDNVKKAFSPKEGFEDKKEAEDKPEEMILNSDVKEKNAGKPSPSAKARVHVSLGWRKTAQSAPTVQSIDP